MKTGLFRAFGVAVATIGLSYYGLEKRKQNAEAVDTETHYTLGARGAASSHDVDVGKADHHSHRVTPHTESIVSNLTGPDKVVLTADSFQSIPQEVRRLKANFASLQKQFEDHNLRSVRPPQRRNSETFELNDFSGMALEDLEPLIAAYIKKSERINDRKMPYLEHAMQEQTTYWQDFEGLHQWAGALINRINILKELPAEVSADTGLSMQNISDILKAVEPLENREIQKAAHTPQP